ncbi:hypothetical protein TRVA0_030S00188 [Trichomonascus vanleenenianus]|uniref:uncharacterized protein n=1 Tax=Trichomonascus vanleenenianus TaxID=2268995 RepID=UPI003ECA6618
MPKLFNRFKLHHSDKKKKKDPKAVSSTPPSKPIRDIRNKFRPSQKPAAGSAIESTPQPAAAISSKKPDSAGTSASSSNLSLSIYTTATAYATGNVSENSSPSAASGATYFSQPTSPSTIKTPPSPIQERQDAKKKAADEDDSTSEQRIEANIARLRLLVTFYGIIAGATRYNLSHDLTDIVTSLTDSDAVDLLNSVVSSATSLDVQSVPEIVELMKPYAQARSQQGAHLLYFEQSNRPTKRQSKHLVRSEL